MIHLNQLRFFKPSVFGNLKEKTQTIYIIEFDNAPGHNQIIGSEKLSNWFLRLFSVKGGEIAEVDLMA